LGPSSGAQVLHRTALTLSALRAALARCTCSRSSSLCLTCTQPMGMPPDAYGAVRYCLRECVHAYARPSIYVCLHVWVCKCARKCVYECMRAPACACASVHVCVHTRVRVCCSALLLLWLWWSGGCGGAKLAANDDPGKGLLHVCSSTRPQHHSFHAPAEKATSPNTAASLACARACQLWLCSPIFKLTHGRAQTSGATWVGHRAGHATGAAKSSGCA